MQLGYDIRASIFGQRPGFRRMLMNLVLVGLVIAFVIGIAILKKVMLICFGVVVSFVVGTLADKVVPGELPGGIPGAVLAGWLGFILGHKLLGSFGPSIAGISLLPAFLGAVAIAFLAEVALGSKKKS
jgi:uncharacterized membrane protein YeaQ/YmgE (transglycosylase-associated protein family)